MNYAIWKLNFVNPEYGTGPEDKIAELGGWAEGAWVDGLAEEGALILGYVSATQDEVELEAWDFQNVNEADALDFCQSINPEAYVAEGGKISIPHLVEEA